ncbi:MAG: malectin domain-containing carbohydrate-binding protein, partial [Verrucomicrobia bacterium]|nr:malectin domain-containing carbohydrate-binding protein [Verrucomicrobiota bacterium]
MRTLTAFVLVAMTGMACADVIVCPPEAPANVRLAAQEIRRYVYVRTGTLLPVAKSGTGIVLKIDPTLERQQFKLKTAGNGLTVSGGSDLAVLYGAYAFAEKLGVRFYLHGDVVPDGQVRFAIPDLDETGTPAFETRGILPFHDFPEGPDLWAADDYKAVLSQMVKLRMNFLGLHTYTECGWGSEPTAWLGLPQDVKENGDPLYSYAAHYFNTARDASGHQPRRVQDMLFGGALLLESDPWGPPVMKDVMPQGKTLEEKNQVFMRAGTMLRDVFSYAHRFGVRTCVGTEIPLTDPARLLPLELRAHLKEKGLSVTNRATLKELYKGTFLRAARTYPLDYYWLWTPESWRGPRSDAETQASIDDLQVAVEAAREMQAPFTLATAGWVLGPARDRAMFDKLLPKEMPFAALNLELGTIPVDEGFSRLKERAGWAIPWMEDDLSVSSPELWVGRIRRDAYDAHRYGCKGLIGIHWRTEEVGPMVAALAQAQWQVPQAAPVAQQAEAVRVEGGETTSFSAPVANTDSAPIYQTVRYDVRGYELAVPNGRYRVTLQFNEPFYNAAGKRVFGVTLQGRTVIDRLDIFARAGKNKALDFSFEDVEVTGGLLKIGFLKDVSSQLIGADKQEALGKYVEFPCIAGIVAAGPEKTIKVNCGGPAWNDYVADPGLMQTARYLPVEEFYLDWARHQFGAEAAQEIAQIFARIDGHLPTPAPYCPGGIAINNAPWSTVQGEYGFVDELSALQQRIHGSG